MGDRFGDAVWMRLSMCLYIKMKLQFRNEVRKKVREARHGKRWGYERTGVNEE